MQPPSIAVIINIVHICQQSIYEMKLILFCRLKFPTILVIYQVITLIITGKSVDGLIIVHIDSLY